MAALFAIDIDHISIAANMVVGLFVERNLKLFLHDIMFS
jgi:hypothetical protein